jgi:uncharacterized protein Yka (UPF0111/DUF47 family)
MPFSLMPRETKFFDLFDEAMAILRGAADRFVALLTEWEHLRERGDQLRGDERACDEAVGRILEALDRSFITPFDREDIHTLATSIDDVMDNLEEAAHRFVTFRIDRPTPEALKLAEIMRQCVGHLAEAIRLCRSFKNADAIRALMREVSRLENEADRIYRDADGAFFLDPPDTLTLIKWRELYGWLEESVDACREVADVISEIVVKGS